MNLREFKAKLNKLVKEAYSLLEASSYFTANHTSIQIDDKDPYKVHERNQAYHILTSLEDFIADSEILISKPAVKGFIKKNKEGQYKLNSHIIDEDTWLEVKLWNEEEKEWEWREVSLEEDKKGYKLMAVTSTWKEAQREEQTRKITGLEARIKNFPPIWGKFDDS